MARKFKCRNGTILEEKLTELGDDYICLYDPTGSHKKGERVSLLSGRRYGKQYSIGGAYGGDYDIVEELKPKKQKKEAALAKAKWFEYAGDKRIELLLDVVKSLHLPYEIKAYTQFGLITEKTITIRV